MSGVYTKKFTPYRKVEQRLPPCAMNMLYLYANGKLYDSSYFTTHFYACTIKMPPCISQNGSRETMPCENRDLVERKAW